MQYIYPLLGWCLYQAHPGNETEGVHAGNQNPAGNQTSSGHTFHGLTFQSVMLVLCGAVGCSKHGYRIQIRIMNHES